MQTNKDEIIKCIGRAVAPYAFKLGEFYHNDKDYADNAPFNSIKTEAENIYKLLHQELQKAREEERERIEAIFKEHVPPHAMDLEDSVWLKRLLNKAFQHENLY